MNDQPAPPADDKQPPAPADHWCAHPGCRRWGSFGSRDGDRTRWTCGEHRTAGAPVRPYGFTLKS